MGAGTAYSHYLLLFFVHFESNERQGQKGSHQPASHPSPPPKSQKSAWLRSECWAASLPWVLLAFVIFCACGAQTCGFSSPVLWARVMRTCLVCMCQLLRLIKHHRGAPSLSVDQSFPSFFFFKFFFFFFCSWCNAAFCFKCNNDNNNNNNKKPLDIVAAGASKNLVSTWSLVNGNSLSVIKWNYPNCPLFSIIRLFKLSWQNKRFDFFPCLLPGFLFPPRAVEKKNILLICTDLDTLGIWTHEPLMLPTVMLLLLFFFQPSLPPSLHLSVCLCAHLLELSAWSSVFLCASVCLWLWLVCFLMFLRFCKTSEWNAVLMWQLGKTGSQEVTAAQFSVCDMKKKEGSKTVLVSNAIPATVNPRAHPGSRRKAPLSDTQHQTETPPQLWIHLSPAFGSQCSFCGCQRFCG